MVPRSDNSALELDRGFAVATGFECSAPVIRGGLRQDELVKTGHWQRYAEDFALAADFGIRFVRYGVPFHVIARSSDPRQFDWSWTDRALGALRDAGLEPILDLLHFGLPNDIAAVGDPRLVERYVTFAREVAERYPWVRYYTPVNEPLVTAVMSARAGLWNERRRDDRSFIAALDRVVTCTVIGMQIIRQRRPDAIFIQSDGCDSYQAADATVAERTHFLNERRFVAWDLAYGRRPADVVTEWLAANGLGEDRLAWYAENGSSDGCIVGHDYYRGNEWIVMPDGSARRAGPAGAFARRAGLRRRGYRALAWEYHLRFGLPFMVSETNIGGHLARNWLAEVWGDALALREEGLPIRGICWYGFVDHVDWDCALAVNRGRVNACGLVGLDRRPHAVGVVYRELARAAADGVYRPLDRTRSPAQLRPAA